MMFDLLFLTELNNDSYLIFPVLIQIVDIHSVNIIINQILFDNKLQEDISCMKDILYELEIYYSSDLKVYKENIFGSYNNINEIYFFYKKLYNIDLLTSFFLIYEFVYEEYN